MPPGDVVVHMYNAIQYFPLEGRVLDRIVRKRDNIGSHQAMLSRTRTMRHNTFSSVVIHNLLKVSLASDYTQVFGQQRFFASFLSKSFHKQTIHNNVKFI
jgi:hypothetical protein